MPSCAISIQLADMVFSFPYTLYQMFHFQVEVKFADGTVFNLSAEFLRVYSPAADAKIRSIGGEKVL